MTTHEIDKISLENSAFGEFLKDLDEGYLTLRKVFR